MATQGQDEIEGFLKKVKAAPVEEISVAASLDVEKAEALLQKMVAEGLVDLRPSRRYDGAMIAVGTNKLLLNEG
jgi:DNA-binding IclR family transcriptional regulator